MVAVVVHEVLLRQSYLESYLSLSSCGGGKVKLGCVYVYRMVAKEEWSKSPRVERVICKVVNLVKGVIVLLGSGAHSVRKAFLL